MKDLYLRDFRSSDRDFIKDNAIFPIPDVDNALFFVKKTITDGAGNIVGVGLSKLTCEAMFILDQKQPAVTLARATKELTLEMVITGRAMGMDESHVFIDDDKFRTFLKKHLKFVDSKGGKVLYLDFGLVE